MDSTGPLKYRAGGGREVTFDGPIKESPESTRQGSKRRWGLPTPRGSLSTRSLVKDLRRSMSDFVSPFFGNSHLDTSNKLFDSLYDDAHQAPSTRRSRASRYMVERTEPSIGDASSAWPHDSIDPFVAPASFRNAVISSNFSSTRSPHSLSEAAGEEDHCRKQLAASELSLEHLKGEIAAKLSIAQSFADECSTGEASHQSAVQFLPGVLQGPWELTADRLSAAERCEVLLRGPIMRTKRADCSPAYVIDEGDRPYNVDYSVIHRLHGNERDLSSRSPSRQNSLSSVELPSLASSSIAPLGSLSACLAMSVDNFPAMKNTDIEYIDALIKLPVLCFAGSISLSDVEALPNLKQDSKDLTRDIVCINGIRVPGVAGYRHVYRKVARELLPPELRSLYTREASGDHPGFPQRSSSSPNLVAGAMGCSGLELPVDVPASVIEGFCRAELQALMLLHFVNRTLAGGHGFEKVLTVFGNDRLSLIVPNSKAAQPLDIILPQCHEGRVAILRSHTSFRVFAAGSSPEPVNRYADIDSYFMADILLASALDDGALGRACAHIIGDADLQPDDVKHLLSPRLMEWMTAQAKDVCSQSSNNGSLNAIHYRIYLNCHTAPQSDA